MAATRSPFPPVALRVFGQTDDVLVFAEVYDRADRAAHSVDITTTVTETGGAVLWKHSAERSSSDLGSNGAYAHLVRVPMSAVEPGRYVLTVEARSQLGDVASRRVPFEVVEHVP